MIPINLWIMETQSGFQVIEPNTKCVLITAKEYSFAKGFQNGFIDYINSLQGGPPIENTNIISYLLGIETASTLWEQMKKQVSFSDNQIQGDIDGNLNV
jgi:hypothetical protein